MYDERYKKIYIEMKESQFDMLIKQLPSLLENGWKLSDRYPDDDYICRDYHIYDYTESDVDNVSLFIQKKNIDNPDMHMVSIRPISTEYEISTERGRTVLERFEKMLGEQGVALKFIVTNND